MLAQEKDCTKMYNARKVPESGRDLKRVNREFFTQAVVERHEHGNDCECYSSNEVVDRSY